jgi:SAM-dependent methyltransferase
VEAFKSGKGVPWSAYGQDMREAQSDFNRPLFENQFVDEHLADIPGLIGRLEAPAARVAEIGFGGGWASIAVAKAFPNAIVDGFDNDEASVDLATQNAADAGVGRRVAFHARDAGDSELAGRYDLVFAFECVHDMSNPVEALASMKRLVAPGGTVLVVDERVAENFGDAIGDPIERIMYGWSTLCCLTNGLADSPSAGTGTVLRRSTLEDYARQADFSAVDELPIEHDLFRYYELVA